MLDCSTCTLTSKTWGDCWNGNRKGSCASWRAYLLEVVICLVLDVLREERLRGNGGETGDGDTLRDGGESRHLSGHLRCQIRRCTRQHAQQDGPGLR